MAGLAVPEEVAIVGIDNDTLGQHLTRIPLTSVSQGTHEMGRVAARMLLERLADPDRAIQDVVLPTRLIVRTSCGCDLSAGHFAEYGLQRADAPGA